MLQDIIGILLVKQRDFSSSKQLVTLLLAKILIDLRICSAYWSKVHTPEELFELWGSLLGKGRQPLREIL